MSDAPHESHPKGEKSRRGPDSDRPRRRSSASRGQSTTKSTQQRRPKPGQHTGNAAPSPARSPVKAAWHSLKSFDPSKGKFAEDTDDGLTEHGDRAIAAALKDGAIRHGVLLDLLIAHGSTVKPSKMERAVLIAARLGVLQYLRGVPPHAAVSEGVGLIPGNHRAKGLLNAVLRRATEMVTSRPLTPDERAAWVSSTNGTRESLSSPHRIVLQNRWLLESSQALFPPDAASRLLLMSGVPRWLSESLLESLDQREHDTVLLAATESPAIWFRLTARNPSGARETLKQWPTEWAPEQEDGKRPDAFTVTSDHVPLVLNSQAFRSGWITVQDLAAQLPAMVAAPKQGWKCLDLCAAPGGKTVQLAEAVGPKGLVIAVDVSGDRLRSVKQNVDRMGLTNTRGIVADATTATFPDCGSYDFALADVPCSNTGVMGRRIEVKFRLSSKDAAELKPIQLAILTNAAKHLKPGGILVHSTCSLLDSENGALVREFLENQGGDTSGWRMLDERLTIPLAGSHDGGYVAVLKKP